MTENYWDSQDAALAMGRYGKTVGLRQGKEEGYEEGLADGFARGRKYGHDEAAAALQSQIDALSQQKNALQELTNGLVMTLGAAVEVLKQANDDTKVQFALHYVQRVDNAIRKGQLRLSPHADPNFSRQMTHSTALIRDALETTLRVHKNNQAKGFQI